MSDANDTTKPLVPAPQNWVERWRARLPAGSKRRRLYDVVALPIQQPTEFMQGETTLVAELMPHTGDDDADAERALEILTEAQDVFARADERAEGAERRATTLQGAVAIATSLVVAAAALSINQTRLEGAGWRVSAALLAGGITVALVMTGIRALSATSTIHRWHRPTAGDMVRRSQVPVTQARIELAAETLVDYSFNTKIAGWKIAYLGAAAWWFRVALGLLVALALVLTAYAFAAPTSTSTKRPSVTVPLTGRSFYRHRWCTRPTECH
jgi:hypothetical protein